MRLARKVAEDLVRGFTPTEGERARLKELAMDFAEEDERLLLLHAMLQDAIDGLPDTDANEIVEHITEIEMHPNQPSSKLPEIEG